MSATGRHFLSEDYRDGLAGQGERDGVGVVSHAGVGLLCEKADLSVLVPRSSSIAKTATSCGWALTTPLRTNSTKFGRCSGCTNWP